MPSPRHKKNREPDSTHSKEAVADLSDPLPLLETCSVGLKDEFDLVAYATEISENFLFGALSVRGIIEAPVMAIHLAGIHRANLVSVAAHGDHGRDLLLEEFVHVLRAMIGDIDSDFLEHLDGLRMHIAGGLRTGAADVDQVASGGLKDTFSHVAAAGIPCAKNEYFGFHVEIDVGVELN